jgi:hypothetical protein
MHAKQNSSDGETLLSAAVNHCLKKLCDPFCEFGRYAFYAGATIGPGSAAINKCQHLSTTPVGR